MFVNETNIYSVQKGGGKPSINIIVSKMETFFVIHIMSGIIKLPSYKLYLG